MGTTALILSLGAYASLHIAVAHIGVPPFGAAAHLDPATSAELSGEAPWPTRPWPTRNLTEFSQRALVAPEDVDQRYLAMLFAFEDRRFYSHYGVDFVALARAGLQFVRHGRIVSGGSTLTMQVARLLEGRYERTGLVKLRQIVRAVQLETTLTKRQILSLYLTLAPFGGRLNGVSAACLTYFGKGPQHLSVGEAALLVALPQAPTARRLDRYPEAARRARDFVLKTVVAAGVLSPDEAAQAKLEPVTQPRPAPAPPQQQNIPEVSIMHPSPSVPLTLITTAVLAASAAPVAGYTPQHLFLADYPVVDSVRHKLLSTDLADGAKDDRTGLWTFYASRRDPIWVDKTGLTPRALAVIEEIKRADDWGLRLSDFDPPSLPTAGADGPKPTGRDLADAEMRLSLAVLKYARYAHGGRVEDPATQLSAYLDRTPPLRRPWLVMTEIAAAETPDAYLRGLNPRHPQFERLRQQYLARRGGDASAAVTIPASGSKLFPGKRHQDVALIRRRLGVPASNGEETRYDEALAQAVEAFQKKRDISPANGVIDRKTRLALNAAQSVGAKTLLANMEEWRWMPQDLGSTYVWVNVPEFLVRVVKDGKIVHQERIIAGQVDKQTPIFSADLHTIYFHPRWNLPESIKVKEIRPSLAGGGGRFRRMGLQISRNGHEVPLSGTDWSQADMSKYDIYQPPGPDNALGLMKFTFLNKHSVYMHDTPNKDLFSEDVRTFSHGCVRVRNPARLAEVLLAIDKGWDAARIKDLIDNGPQDNGISLDTHIPVHITYFTAEVDDDGELETQSDVYGHEKRITLALAGKWDEIDKNAPADVADLEQAEPRSEPRERVSARRARSSSTASIGFTASNSVSRGTTANDIFRSNFGF